MKLYHTLLFVALAMLIQLVEFTTAEEQCEQMVTMNGCISIGQSHHCSWCFAQNAEMGVCVHGTCGRRFLRTPKK